jgi:hypothetical protein
VAVAVDGIEVVGTEAAMVAIAAVAEGLDVDIEEGLAEEQKENLVKAVIMADLEEETQVEDEAEA